MAHAGSSRGRSTAMGILVAAAVTVVGAGFVLGGCGNDGGAAVAQCAVGQGAGRICAERVGGSVELRGQGLRPGTRVDVTWTLEGATQPVPPTAYAVTVDGTLQEPAALSSASPVRTTAEVSGVDEDGSVVAATLVVEP